MAERESTTRGNDKPQGTALAERPPMLATVQQMRTGSAVQAAAVARATALAQAPFVMALNRPRDADAVYSRLVNRECKRPVFAAKALYRKPIGKGQTIEGLSIRFAEAAMQCYGNFAVETKAIEETRETRTLVTTAYDYENNVTWSEEYTVEKTVERKHVREGQEVLGKRLNSYGEVVYLVLATEGDLLVKEGAMVSKHARNCVLHLLPADLKQACLDQIKATQSDADAKDPDDARRRLFTAFAEVGVPVDELKRYLGHDASALSPAELGDLRGVYQAIKDGETTWRDVIEKGDAGPGESAKPAPSNVDAVKEELRAKRAAKPAAAPDGPA